MIDLEIDKELNEKDFLDLLWKYFTLHAQQRTQMLHFFILVESFLITGLITLFKTTGELLLFRFIISFAITFFAFIFYNLDIRTKKIIKYSENGIKIIENKYESFYGKNIMIFSTETDLTEKEKKKFFKPLSYSRLFKMIFVFYALIGLLSCVLSLIL